MALRALVIASLVPCLATKDLFSNGINQPQKQPHIIFILADDLGWNDVAFHGSNQIPTPNIDALAYSGCILQNYYTTAICTPSRSALMTGKYPIHNGMQHTVIYGPEPRGLPLNEILLPQYLESLGYENHIVGKWHLGHFQRIYTPLYRGFKSHVGFWTGHQDYNDHTAVETPYWGLDMRRGMEIAYDLHGSHTTNVITEESVQLIQNYNSTSPLFLYIAHAAVHSSNPYNPLPAPDADVASFPDIENYQRRKFAGMLNGLDASVGRVVEALKNANMLADSIIIFSTDNGGPAEGFNLNAASNWPLRGVKNTLWEGGVRGAGLIWSPRLTASGRVCRQLMHISDWLPTLYTAGGGNSADIKGIDGIDQWTALQQNLPSKRSRILLNIDDIYGNAAITIWPWKYLSGTTYNGSWDGWYGPSGRENIRRYDIGQVLGSQAHRAISTVLPSISPKRIQRLRAEVDVQCPDRVSNEAQFSNCQLLKEDCLFNLEEDPCEMNNLAQQQPQIFKMMATELRIENLTAVRPNNKPLDPRGNPKLWNNVWTNFGDYDCENETERLANILANSCPGGDVPRLKDLIQSPSVSCLRIPPKTIVVG